MDLATALPTFVITLREGVEAALVVGIVLACLGKAGQRHLNRWVYGGVLAGVVGSVLIGLFLGMGLQQLQAVLPQAQGIIKPLIETLFGSIAIIMLSWMLIWMTRQSRSLKGSLENAVQDALSAQQAESAGWSLFSLICIAVLREGFETVLFLFTHLKATLAGVGGAVAGLTTAALLGFGLFQWGLRIDLRRFFQIMGVLLLLIVAGLVVSVCRNLDAAFAAISQAHTIDLCFASQSCILGPQLWDASTILPDKQFPGVVLKVLLGYRDHVYVMQVIAYVGFLAGIGGSYFRSLQSIHGSGSGPGKAADAAPSSASQSTVS
ncbi:MAG: FTR1 family protein [Cyanobacteria bacterium J06632_22]